MTEAQPLYNLGAVVILDGLGVRVRDRQLRGDTYFYLLGEQDNIENGAWFSEEKVKEMEVGMSEEKTMEIEEIQFHLKMVARGDNTGSAALNSYNRVTEALTELGELREENIHLKATQQVVITNGSIVDLQAKLDKACLAIYEAKIQVAPEIRLCNCLGAQMAFKILNEALKSIEENNGKS